MKIEAFPTLRSNEIDLKEIENTQLDALIIGGGINGAVSALALSTHGLNVAVVESNDFASGVSQQSSNLVWGGFKYLESYEVRLVAELCHSRNRLARAYPTRLSETRFLATLDDSSPFSPWFAALGSNAYWALGQFATLRPRYRSPRTIRRLEPSVAMGKVKGGIEYSDHLLIDNDARFVAQLIVDAREKGALAANYLSVTSTERVGRYWKIKMFDEISHREIETSARVIINTAGPEIHRTGAMLGAETRNKLVFSKGVHLIVPKITDSGRILAFFDDQNRLFYVIPMGHRSVIGTTDTRVETHEVEVSETDYDFLLTQANQRLNLPSPLLRSDVISSRVGVRPLVVEENGVDLEQDWTELSRRHAVEINTRKKVVSVLGGKLSDCLNVGEEVVKAVEKCGLKTSKPSRRWYGEPSQAEKSIFFHSAEKAGIEKEFASTIWRRHGRRAHEIVEDISNDPQRGICLSAIINYCPAELESMRSSELIETLDDFLRRRTNLKQIHSETELKNDPALKKVSDLLFNKS